MRAKSKPNGAPTIHRDGTVSYWSVYRQQWTREERERIDDRERAAMSEEDRRRIFGGWWGLVSFGGAGVTAYPTDWPRGPWKAQEEGERALDRWVKRRGLESIAGTIWAAHNIRIVGPYRTRKEARRA